MSFLQKISSNELQLPGVPRNQETEPAVATLPFPSLKRTVWLPPCEGEVAPGACIAEKEEHFWSAHPTYASDFKTALDKFNAEFGGRGDRSVLKASAESPLKKQKQPPPVQAPA